ncbi:MAG: hypothetical protein OEQ81_02900 [Flavobacteriaceae bacterium]|nr:hypothetical protein [Flavobacteriaceae bacterium]
MKDLDKILLGHNPLFGVDHLSQERGNAKEQKFGNRSALNEILRYAHSKGVKAMMMSTHPRAEVILDIIDKDPVLKDDFTIYPLLPYIVKYVRQSNEKGMFNVLKGLLSQAGASKSLSMLMTGLGSLVGGNLYKGIRILIDIEMLPFKGHKLGAIFMHDALVDLALGLGCDEVYDVFREHIEKKYAVPGGLITKNVPMLVDRLEGRGWEDYLIMAAFNKTGFYINPSLEATEAVLKNPGMNFIPMSTLAAGAIPPREAFEYVGQFPEIKSVVVGMSKKSHIDQTVDLINKYIK